MVVTVDPDSVTIAYVLHLYSMLNLTILALRNSFLKARSGKEERINDLG